MRVRRRQYKRMGCLLLGVFVAVFLFTFLVQGSKQIDLDVQAASLANFDPGYIISDYQMGNYNSMSEAEIQAFLTAKNPCGNRDRGYYDTLMAKYNGRYVWHWNNDHFVCLSEELFGDGEVIGSGETAAHIIWQAAQDYKINPQVLMVLLQKETSLITDPIPNDGDYRKATGYGCPDTAPCSAEYYGFKNQVRKAAALFRTVLDGGWTNYPLGDNYVQYNPNPGCGGSVVNIRSLATSALYRYTPYQPNPGAITAGYGTAECGAYGNRNFYLYFEDWFGGIAATKEIAAPTNISSVLGDRSITISWSDPSDVGLFGQIKYEVVIADSNGREIKVEVDGNTKQYTFNNLDNGLYIAASVKAVATNSSNYDRITFDYNFGGAPSEPLNLRVDRENGGIKVMWDNPVNNGGLTITKYEVVLADVDKNTYLQEVTGDVNSVVFYGLPLNEYFATSVKAFNVAGDRYSRITFSIKTYAEFNNNVGVYDGFYDMPSDNISRTAVSWAAYNGITDKNQYFNGEQPLTRRQAMVLLWRISGQPASNYYDGFYDMPSDNISRTAVSWAAYNGITDKNQYFNGEQPLTRRQAMVLLWRIFNKV